MRQHIKHPECGADFQRHVNSQWQNYSTCLWQLCWRQGKNPWVQAPFPFWGKQRFPCQWKQLVLRHTNCASGGISYQHWPGCSTVLPCQADTKRNWSGGVGTCRRSWFVSKILISAFSIRELFSGSFLTHLLKLINSGTSALWQQSGDSLGLSAADWTKGIHCMHSSKLA